MGGSRRRGHDAAASGRLVCAIVAVGLTTSVLVVALAPTASAAEPTSASTPPIEFGRDILPLLQQHCFHCHAGQTAPAGVRLDVRSELLGETQGQPLVVPGKSGASALIARLTSQDPQQRMPPPDAGPPLATDAIERLRRWIDQGLAWDDNLLPPPAEHSDHWAFQPVRRPALPHVARREWLGTPVDAFIAASQERHALTPNPVAERGRLLRRLSLDLTGLPPDWDNVAEFVADESPDAWHRCVDRLLASPRYGERWGRHWLDVARWAESEGFESNHVRPSAWRYRDYVVSAFNRDLPWDQFLREQLAGDELTTAADPQLIATGFLAGARLSSNEEDKTLQRTAVLVDIVNMVGEGVLGLTFGCAQCHNHKFDPLTQRDYYRLLAFFVRGQPANLVLQDPQLTAAYERAKPAEYEPATRLAAAIFERARAELLAQRRKQLAPPLREALDLPPEDRTPAQQELARQADLELQLLTSQIEQQIPAADKPLYEALKKKIAALEKQLPERPQTWGFYSPATSPLAIDVLPMPGFYPLVFEADALRQASAYLLVRGDVHRRGPRLAPGWPAFLDNPADATASSTPSPAPTTRMQLVDWLVDPRHPLTTRVWVNRVWQYHFGRGLVATPGDFGLQGAPPTHPELLDFLASEFPARGWSTKQLHRELVLSSTYRMSAEALPAGMQRDPANQYWWRFAPRRLEAEAIRDSLLAVAGQLRHSGGGPSDDEKTSRRRTLYVLQKRDQLPEIQRLFDGASAQETCGRRYVSTVSLQPLYLLNGGLASEASARFADRVAADEPSDRRRQVERAFCLALGRPPAAAEATAALAFLEQPAEDAASPWSPLRQFCQLLLNLDEFVYLE